MICFCRGSALQKRLRDREKEMEADERDRKREKEELEEIRQRLLAEGHPDPDAELQRVRYIRNSVLLRLSHHFKPANYDGVYFIREMFIFHASCYFWGRS